MFRSGKALIDSEYPQRTAICERCGTLHNLINLSPQYRWSGFRLVNTGYLVCSQCLDEPIQQEQTVVITADPPPAGVVRLNRFPLEEANQLTLQKAPGVKLFSVVSSMNVKLT
jgi:hypothetical protein